MENNEFKIKDVDKPNLMKKIFPYDKVPRINFNNENVPLDIPDDIFITDTTFRDGQQGYAPFTLDHILHLFDYLHKLGGPNGVIRSSEFFLYSKKDKEAVELCLERGYKYPNISGWIRANKSDFHLVKEAKLEETGILTSISDYHIFYKFNKSRNEVIENYFSIVEDCLKQGIACRCHLEDITRADINGVVIPFAKKLMSLSDKYNLPVKIRLCDTLGLGVPYAFATLPRSIPKMVWNLINKANVPHNLLEFHGHNDFGLAVANAVSAWIYGVSSVNGTFLGIGERTGNTPIESMIIQIMGLKQSEMGIDTKTIHEIADYFTHELEFNVPPYYPIVGENFNVTRAGIHADGLIKNEEIYLPFDTFKILGSKPSVAVTNTSGLAGIVFWINSHFELKGDNMVTKTDPEIMEIYNWIKDQYDNGRIISISDVELRRLTRKHYPDIISRITIGRN